MKFNNYITYKELTDNYIYDSTTGILTNIVGVRVGSVQAYGYRRLKIQGKWYPVHRLAWFYVHSTWPVGVIDHINGNRDDNRLVNLRCVSIQENNRNKSNLRPQYIKKYIKKADRIENKVTVNSTDNKIEINNRAKTKAQAKERFKNSSKKVASVKVLKAIQKTLAELMV